MDFVVWVSCVLVEVKDVEIDAFAVKKKKKGNDTERQLCCVEGYKI